MSSVDVYTSKLGPSSAPPVSFLYQSGWNGTGGQDSMFDYGSVAAFQELYYPTLSCRAAISVSPNDCIVRYVTLG